MVAILGVVTNAHAQDQWVPCNGDAIAFGRPAAMVAKPDGHVFFACDADRAGYYGSSDRGEHWQNLNFNDWCYSMVATPNGTLYAGGYQGLARSTNNGASWQDIKAIRTKVTLLAAGTDNSVYAAYSSTILRSTDDGVTWTNVTSNLGVTGFVSLMATPTSVYAGSLVALYKSTNQGVSWARVPSFTSEPLDVLAHGRQGVLYAAGLEGVFVSIDDGASWKRWNNAIRTKTVQALSVDSLDRAYASTQSGIYRSTDFGTTWQPLFGKDSTFRPYTACIASDGGSNFYVGIHSSSEFSYISRSTDAGDTWPLPPDRGISVSYVSHLFVDRDQSLYASTDRGLYRTSTGGNSWERLRLSASDGARFCTSTSNGTFFAIGEYNGPHRSTDQGRTWTIAASGLPALDTFGHRHIAGITSTASGLVFAITTNSGTLYRSENNGASWDSVSSLTNFFNGRGVYRNLTAVGNYLFLGVNGKATVDTFAVYFSSDLGKNWTPCGQPTWKYDASVCFNPYTGYLMAGRLRSSDNGESWISRSCELPGPLYVAGAGYLFCDSVDYQSKHHSCFSTDDGETWTRVNAAGLVEYTKLISFALDSSGVIYGGTQTRGVSRRVGVPLAVKSRPVERHASFEMVDDYLTIEGSISSIEVFDALGRQCETTIVRTSGASKVDVRSYTRGLYFAKLNGVRVRGFFVR